MHRFIRFALENFLALKGSGRWKMKFKKLKRCLRMLPKFLLHFDAIYRILGCLFYQFPFFRRLQNISAFVYNSKFFKHLWHEQTREKFLVWLWSEIKSERWRLYWTRLPTSRMKWLEPKRTRPRLVTWVCSKQNWPNLDVNWLHQNHRVEQPNKVSKLPRYFLAFCKFWSYHLQLFFSFLY